MNLRLKIQQIKDEQDYSTDQLYLLESIDGQSGFLLGGEKVYFVITHQNSNNDSISTQFLSLKTNVFINTIENDPTFNPGNYDLLIYSGEFDNVFFESFVELCSLFIQSSSKISFIDFFYSLLKLFELPKEVSFTNLIGLFGELYFIKSIYEQYCEPIYKHWHTSLGPNDKYDFSLPTFNIEIKTTIKDGMRFEIKHSQIFNEKENYVAVINIDGDNSGLSVSDLYNYFRNTKPFSDNIEFMIRLQKEKQKVSEKDFVEKKFSHIRTLLFHNKDLETLKDVPNFIDSIKYNYDFASQNPVSIDSVFLPLREEN